MLLIIPILLFESTRYTLLKNDKTIPNYINNSSYPNNIINKDIQNKNEKKIRLFETKHTSGRTELWEMTIKKYEKNKFFGYGPQADRFLLANFKETNRFGTNVSNSFIYAFLCGGYIAVIIFIFIYYKIFFLICNFFYKKIFLKKIDNSIKISIVFLIFFSIRSLIENSFSLFSIDFLLFLISFSILENFFKKKKL